MAMARITVRSQHHNSRKNLSRLPVYFSLAIINLGPGNLKMEFEFQELLMIVHCGWISTKKTLSTTGNELDTM